MDCRIGKGFVEGSKIDLTPLRLASAVVNIPKAVATIKCHPVNTRNTAWDADAREAAAS